MIKKEISEAILTVGQTYKEPRGGISGVISTYSRHFNPFKFVSTYNPALNKYLNVFQFFWSLFPLIGNLLIDKDIKIVHMHGAERGSLFRKYIVLKVAKGIFGKKVIFHSHGAEFHLFYSQGWAATKSLVKGFISEVDLVICLSQQWKDFFKENFNIKRIEILENIVEKPLVEIKRSEQPILKLLFLGEIGDRKGIFDLLTVLQSQRAFLISKVHLTIGGKGEVDRLLNFIKQHKLEELVTFKGWVSGDLKQTLLSETDIYILPSYNEGLPVSILEALSYGVPVISTRVGGIPEVVRQEQNGFIIEPGDQMALFLSLKRFLEELGLKERMGKQSLSIVTPYYSEAVIPKLERLYGSILST